jgi:hypothetical protein
MDCASENSWLIARDDSRPRFVLIDVSVEMARDDSLATVPSALEIDNPREDDAVLTATRRDDSAEVARDASEAVRDMAAALTLPIAVVRMPTWELSSVVMEASVEMVMEACVTTAALTVLVCTPSLFVV